MVSFLRCSFDVCAILRRWPNHFYLEKIGGNDFLVRYQRPIPKSRAKAKLR